MKRGEWVGGGEGRQEKSAVDTFMETGRKRGLRPGPLEAGGAGVSRGGFTIAVT